LSVSSARVALERRIAGQVCQYSRDPGISQKPDPLWHGQGKSEIKKKNFTLLVEGNMDVIAAYQAGIKIQ